MPANTASPAPRDTRAIERIRTLALVGQSAAGKTSLAEALLHQAGAIGAPGSLERGTTVSDYDPMERRAQHSLNTALMHLEHGGTRIHLLDTPGYPDFVGQSMTALEAVETAAVVINASSGVENLTPGLLGTTLFGLLSGPKPVWGRHVLPPVPTRVVTSRTAREN